MCVHICKGNITLHSERTHRVLQRKTSRSQETLPTPRNCPSPPCTDSLSEEVRAPALPSSLLGPASVLH